MKKYEISRVVLLVENSLKAVLLSPFPSPFNGLLQYPLGRNAKLALQEINMP